VRIQNSYGRNPSDCLATERKRRQVRMPCWASLNVAQIPGYRTRTPNCDIAASAESNRRHSGSIGKHNCNRMDNSCVRGKATPASVKRALRYFSTHCCEKKQILSRRDFLRERSASQAPS
jgi:hypothetical protein